MALRFVSGKDSSYNYFKTDEGPISMPCTLLVSGFGWWKNWSTWSGPAFAAPASKLALVGQSSSGLAGSVFARMITQNARCEVKPSPIRRSSMKGTPSAAYERDP